MTIGWNESVLKRSERARKSNKRAQRRLEKMIGEGGIEDQKKAQIWELSRQQEALKRELLGIKLEKIRTILKNHQSDATSLYDEVMRIENFRSTTTGTSRSVPAVLTTNTLNTNLSPRGSINQPKDFGKNYFGYRSSPGVNADYKKKNKKPDKNKKVESSEELNLKAGNEVLRIRNQQKLKEQQLINLEVKEKLDDWKKRNETDKEKRQKRHKSVVSLPPPSTRRQSVSFEKEKKGFNRDYKLPPVDGSRKPIRRRRPSDEDYKKMRSSIDEDIPPTDQDVSADEDDLFNANWYAPDGRIRKVHRLPDFMKSYDEAQAAMYVRTKKKRPHEIHLTVNEIFSTST